MKITILVFSSLLGTCVFAAKIGDSYDQVLVEKGKPSGQITAGNSRVLTYADVSIRLRDNVVVEIKPIETPWEGPGDRESRPRVSNGSLIIRGH